MRSSKDYCFIMLCDQRYKFYMKDLPDDVFTRTYHEDKLRHFLENKGFNYKDQNTPEYPNKIWTPPPISVKSKKIKK